MPNNSLFNPLEHNAELEDIKVGNYQQELYNFTYGLLQDKWEAFSSTKSSEIDNNIVFPIMDQPGLRCTAAIAKKISSKEEPVEIQINFFGTIDFSSMLADMEKGGPGQETLQRYEEKLLKQVDSLLQIASEQFPNKNFKLRLAGHSLGGALAKGFAHSVQRACAIQENTPTTILTTIRDQLKEKINSVSPKLFQSLEEKLSADKKKLGKLYSFSKIKGITVYALGAPGLGKTTDQHASLLTYYHKPDFLSVYHHYHQKDIIPKFGDTEFLAGMNGIYPRINTNKAIEYNLTITSDEVNKAHTLPFPGITKHVMAAHNKKILRKHPGLTKEQVRESDLNHSKVFNLGEASHILNKFTFSRFKIALRKCAFFVMKTFARIKGLSKYISLLESLPTREIVIDSKILRNYFIEDPSIKLSSVCNNAATIPHFFNWKKRRERIFSRRIHGVPASKNPNTIVVSEQFKRLIKLCHN